MRNDPFSSFLVTHNYPLIDDVAFLATYVASSIVNHFYRVSFNYHSAGCSIRFAAPFSKGDGISVAPIFGSLSIYGRCRQKSQDDEGGLQNTSLGFVSSECQLRTASGLLGWGTVTVNCLQRSRICAVGEIEFPKLAWP